VAEKEATRRNRAVADGEEHIKSSPLWKLARRLGTICRPGNTRKLKDNDRNSPNVRPGPQGTAQGRIGPLSRRRVGDHVTEYLRRLFG